jgi:hypothetical protein
MPCPVAAEAIPFSVGSLIEATDALEVHEGCGAGEPVQIGVEACLGDRSELRTRPPRPTDLP